MWLITSDAFANPEVRPQAVKTTKTSVLETPSGHLNYNYPQSCVISRCQSDPPSRAVVRPSQAQAAHIGVNARLAVHVLLPSLIRQKLRKNLLHAENVGEESEYVSKC